MIVLNTALLYCDSKDYALDLQDCKNNDTVKGFVFIRRNVLSAIKIFL